MTSILISLVLVGLFLFLYLKERKTPGFRAPTIVRLIVLIFLILFAIGNIFRYSYNQSPKIPVLVLVDGTKSIHAGDNLNQIKQVIKKIETAPYPKKLYSFTDSIEPLDNYDKALGTQTNISAALDYAREHRPGAVILITDGQHNQKTDPMTAAQNISAPIYTIGIGAKQKSDIAIHSIRKPVSVFLGDTAVIVARIFNKGFENTRSLVKLESKGKLIQSQEIQFLDSDALQELSFSIVPESIGKAAYQINITRLLAEATAANNRKDFSIEVLKNRWQVIYLTNAPSFNSRFIISTLTANNNNNPKSTATFSVIPMISFIGRNIEMPKNLSLNQIFDNADVIILDDINEVNLAGDIIARLNNFSEQGKGFLILIGENFRVGRIQSGISPFELANYNTGKGNIFLELTETGTATPVFFNENGEYLLDNTPPLLGKHNIKNVVPNAWVWAQDKENSAPLIGYRNYKNSKVVQINGFPIWRWGFSSVETEKTKAKFEQFLKNLIRFLAIQDFERFKLTADKTEYLTGEDIIFNLFASTPDGRAWTGLDVRLNIPSANMSIPMYEINSGTYQAEANALVPGEYDAVAIINKDNKEITQTRVRYSVTQQSIEDFTGLNSDLLVKLAEPNDGRYFTADDFLNKNFLPNTIKYRRTLSFTFHNNWYIYLIVTILFGITLFIRKKRGLL